MAQKKMLIMEILPTSMLYKMIYYLKDYFDITLISLATEDKFPVQDYKKIGINIKCFNIANSKYLKNKKIFSGIKEISKIFTELKKLKRKKYDYVLAKTEPNYIGYFLFKIFKNSKKIYFPYDITYLRYKNKKEMPRLEKFFEKYCFENADYIIHKGPKDELKWIDYKIKGKDIQVLPGCFDPWIQPIKKIKKSKEINLVYIGVFNSFYDISRKIQWVPMFESIAKQNINIHIYSNNQTPKFKEKNIYTHTPLPNLELNKIISNYTYGSHIDFFNKKRVDKIFLDTTLGNKMFSYLEAGIPVLVSNDLKFPIKIIKKYNCGVVIKEEDIPNLKRILEKQNYSSLLEGVKVARKELKMSEQIKKLTKELN